MPRPEDIAAENDAQLAELATLCLASARDLAARQLACDDAEAAARLAQALHHMGRSLRQTAALRARLARDLIRGVREDRINAAKQRDAQALVRRAQVEAPLRRLIWNEYEDSDAKAFDEALENRLDEEVLADTFTAEPLQAQIARIKALIRLSDPIPPPAPSAERGRRPEGPQGASAALSAAKDSEVLSDDYWRSSA